MSLPHVQVAIYKDLVPITHWTSLDWSRSFKRIISQHYEPLATGRESIRTISTRRHTATRDAKTPWPSFSFSSFFFHLKKHGQDMAGSEPPKKGFLYIYIYICLSENSVPLNPMVNDHYPDEKWLFHWEYTQHFQTNPYVSMGFCIEAAPKGSDSHRSSAPEVSPFWINLFKKIVNGDSSRIWL